MSFWRTLCVLYIQSPEPKQYALLFPLFDPDFKCCHVVLDKLHNLPLYLRSSSSLKWKYYSLFPVSVFRLEWFGSVSCSGSLAIRLSVWCISRVLWFSVMFVSRLSVTNFKDGLGWQSLWSVTSACRSSSSPFTVRMLLGQTGPNLNQTSRSWEKAAYVQWSCYTVFGFDNPWTLCSLCAAVESTLAMNKSERVLNSVID